MSEQTKAIGRDIRIGLDTGMPARVKEIKEWLASNRGQWEERLTHSFERLFQMGKEKEVSYLQVCFLRTSLLTGEYFYRAFFMAAFIIWIRSRFALMWIHGSYTGFFKKI